jgi:hypothetical protein
MVTDMERRSPADSTEVGALGHKLHARDSLVERGVAGLPRTTTTTIMLAVLWSYCGILLWWGIPAPPITCVALSA